MSQLIVVGGGGSLTSNAGKRGFLTSVMLFYFFIDISSGVAFKARERDLLSRFDIISSGSTSREKEVRLTCSDISSGLASKA